MEELTFRDLVVLQRIEPGTVVEKFGVKINSSFFESANILGTLKQKGYIDFKSSYPGPSEVEVTEVGARMLEVADEKAKEAVDELDLAILQNIVAGYQDSEAIKNKLNIRSGDLAVHLHKLVKQDLASYAIKNLKVSLSITEDGFKKVSAMPRKEKPPEEQIVVTGAPPAEIAEPPALAEAAATTAPAEAVKLDSSTKRKAKMDYYIENWKKNPMQLAVYVIGILIAVACVLAAVYLVLKK
ncbi:MAG: hypothetical protein NTY73_01105 [Candidatus Micrarchaeota archaeon]|nr:hypothetical protein [Candidatus Micrarchaeota archaeon]